MRQGNMLFHRRCRLRSAAAIRDPEIEGGDAMLAEGACEGGAAIHRFGCAISHIFNRSPFNCPAMGNRCASLEQETGVTTGWSMSGFFLRCLVARCQWAGVGQQVGSSEQY